MISEYDQIFTPTQ